MTITCKTILLARLRAGITIRFTDLCRDLQKAVSHGKLKKSIRVDSKGQLFLNS